jgi:hypothetical protein
LSKQLSLRSQNFAGFLQNLGVIEGTEPMRKAYWFSLLTTTTCSGLVYWSLAKLKPQQSNRDGSWLEPKEYISPDDPWWSEHACGEEGVVEVTPPFIETVEYKEKNLAIASNVYILPVEDERK